MFTEPTCYQDCILGLTVLRLWFYLVYERLRLPPPINFDFQLRNVKNVLMCPICRMLLEEVKFEWKIG